jgi:hypothetical protein
VASSSAYLRLLSTACKLPLRFNLKLLKTRAQRRVLQARDIQPLRKRRKRTSRCADSASPRNLREWEACASECYLRGLARYLRLHLLFPRDPKKR